MSARGSFAPVINNTIIIIILIINNYNNTHSFAPVVAIVPVGAAAVAVCVVAADGAVRHYALDGSVPLCS
jgi:uncharacterized membrane protein